GGSGDFFGSDVAIEGDVIMVGAVQHDLSGSVFVFEFDGTDWNETQILKPSSPTSTNYIRFGQSISLSAGRLIVGARHDPEVGGAGFVFEDDGNSWVQTQKLTASDGAIQDNFGWSVDIFGFTAVIGATRTSDGMIQDGSAYVFKLNQNNNEWEEIQKLKASDPQDNMYFGETIEVNDNHLLVGSRDGSNGFNSGAAYYFAFDGNTDEWTFSQKFTGSDTVSGDNFSQGMSLNGNTVAIGAFQDDDLGVVNSAGSVFVFEFQDPNWVETQKIMPDGLAFQDGFGISVAIDEFNDRLFIGATGDDDVANGSGAAFVYDFNVSTWEQSQKLLAVDGAVNDNFAYAVDIDGTTAVVGAQRDPDLGEDSGAVYVFDYDGAQWSLTQKLFPNVPVASSYFGSDVSISGDWMAISAHVPDGGYVYLFKNNAGSWQEMQKLTSSDNATGDFFGRSVDLDDSRLVVGASFDDDNGSSSGSAYVFDEAGGVWSEIDKLIPDDGANNDNFGHAVAVHGDRVVVSAIRADTSIADTGAAYVFELDNGMWNQTEKLIPSDVFDGGFFGIDVALQNQWAMVGASGDDELANNSGAVYVFEFDNNLWFESQKINPTTGSIFDRFGISIDIDGNRLIAGAEGRDTAASNAGAVFSYEFNGVNWSFDQELTAGDARANDFYGRAVAIFGNRVIAGAPGDDNNWVDDGATYITNIANRYDIIINVTGLYERVTIGDSSRSPNRVTFTNAGDSVEFIGGVTPTQLIISNLADDEPYELIYGGDPTYPNQFCTYDPGSAPITGVINDADVVVSMSCDYYEYALSVDGKFLAPGTNAVVSNQTGEQITVNSGEVVAFPTLLDDGSVYQLTVDTQPSSPSQTCTFFNDGYYWMQAATTEFLDCEINQFSVGGSVTGLLAGNEFIIQNNEGDDLLISENGEFVFATVLDDSSTYEVSISQQPQGGPIQNCVVNNQQGNLAGVNITNVQIECQLGDDFIYRSGFEAINPN
ncbi:MAG: FG-GAP repeat protein, partial [Marinicella sp.]